MQHLIITESFGFVLCFTKKSLIILNVDGDEIKRIPLKTNVESVFTFKDNRNIDYVCGKYSNNLMFVFEVMHPENESRIGNIPNSIVFANYNTIRKCFVIIDCFSNVSFIPFILP